MDINTLFNNIPDYVHYKSVSQGEVEDDGSKKLNEINEYSLNNLKRFLNTPLFQQQDIDRAKKWLVKKLLNHRIQMKHLIKVKICYQKVLLYDSQDMISLNHGQKIDGNKNVVLLMVQQMKTQKR